MTSLDSLLREEPAPPPIEPKVRAEVEEIVTPSGMAIRYDDRKHYYWVNGEKVDSVSKILGCLDKPALPWWGMKVGVMGVKQLARDGHLPMTFEVDSVDSIADLLTEHKLTVNHVRDRAGIRGTTVHDALEEWARTGQLPDPNRYADEQQGYVRGLLAFLADATIEPTACEVIVGSAEHRFAGRYDLRATLGACELVTRLVTKKGETTETRGDVPAGSYTIDLKTGKSVYLEAFLQMEAYEGASVECGYEPTDARAVLRVTDDARYELVTSTASYADFLAVKGCHDAVAALKERQAA